MPNLQRLTIKSVSGQAKIDLDHIMNEVKQLASLVVADCIIGPIENDAEDSSFVTKSESLALKDIALPNAPCSDVDQYNRHMPYIARKCFLLCSVTINDKLQDPNGLFKVDFTHFKLASIDIRTSNMEYYKILADLSRCARCQRRPVGSCQRHFKSDIIKFWYIK
ncbi:uncharacterized protein ATC70_000019 [Mucor velutinosus]|uniref:Uncharacterized protein n=1 Tax=Mucor velutinosus TaxID=708070 RepID=A0AAN7D8J2_9FUNG|nr:hypothetical protein ATC70_000019 [Mucor velutinosus]